ncbi:MAG: hypothetical protein H7Y04_03615 [Verrucomicrobia bacterium]|nr:hypothetical protein [Cytophagales bacterium]
MEENKHNLPDFIELQAHTQYRTECQHKQDCMKAIQLIIDDEASPEQIAHFKQNIDKCLVCIENYNLEKTIRQLLCDKLHKKSVPMELIAAIKSQIVNV